MSNYKNIVIKKSNKQIRKDLISYNFQYLLLLIVGFIILGFAEYFKSFLILGLGLLYFILAGQMITYSTTSKIILELRELKKK